MKGSQFNLLMANLYALVSYLVTGVNKSILIILSILWLVGSLFSFIEEHKK